MKIAQHFSWDRPANKSPSPRSGRLNSRILFVISRPFHGLQFRFTFVPTDESVGYFHVVRAADENRSYFSGKATQTLNWWAIISRPLDADLFELLLVQSSARDFQWCAFGS